MPKQLSKVNLNITVGVKAVVKDTPVVIEMLDDIVTVDVSISVVVFMVVFVEDVAVSVVTVVRSVSSELKQHSRS